jgi:hypothetical protein
MQRREFLTASTAVALGAALSDGARAAGPAGAKQVVELRTYHFASSQKRQAYERFMAAAAIPALNRAGVKPVGVFTFRAEDNADVKPGVADANNLYVLLPHESPVSLLTLDRRLLADGAFREAGRAVLDAPKSDPAYTRYETSILVGFDQCPRVEVPTTAPGRLVQLRIYESHNEERAKKKVHMFDEGGEIAIFRRVGMHPVFFGEAVAGSRMPNLTYLLAFDDAGKRDAAWNAFRGDPQWKELSADEAYKDTVTNITNLVLRPAAGSQV